MAFQFISKPTKGNLLRVHRKEGYYHFGIATSDHTVIHFTAEKSDLSKDKKDFLIIETSLERFLLKDKLEIEMPYSSPYDRDDVVKRAKNYANSHSFRGKPYHFINNNCEHFARYCYEGRIESRQVIEGATVVAAAATAVVGAVGSAILSHTRKKKAEEKKLIK